MFFFCAYRINSTELWTRCAARCSQRPFRLHTVCLCVSLVSSHRAARASPHTLSPIRRYVRYGDISVILYSCACEWGTHKHLHVHTHLHIYLGERERLHYTNKRTCARACVCHCSGVYLAACLGSSNRAARASPHILSRRACVCCVCMCTGCAQTIPSSVCSCVCMGVCVLFYLFVFQVLKSPCLFVLFVCLFLMLLISLIKEILTHFPLLSFPTEHRMAARVADRARDWCPDL